MKIIIHREDGKRVYRFNVKSTIREFQQLKDPALQQQFLIAKSSEMESANDPKLASFFSRLKLKYLFQWRYYDYILIALSKFVEDEKEFANWLRGWQ